MHTELTTVAFLLITCVIAHADEAVSTEPHDRQSTPAIAAGGQATGQFSWQDFGERAVLIHSSGSAIYFRRISTPEAGENAKWLGVTEVSQAQWLMVMADCPSEHTGSELPVTNVSWYDANDYCDSFKDLPVRIRLPSVSEWESACNCTGYPDFEEAPAPFWAWYQPNSPDGPHPVGTKPANPKGFYNMLGNVQEWCLDQDQMRMGMKEFKGQDIRQCKGGEWGLPNDLHLNCDTTWALHAGDSNSHMGFRILAEMKESAVK
ncbi:formylglycine-generating enzyme family protein [bacterium]|nr:formylglycine-generating enzyme family protein [bacterium]